MLIRLKHPKDKPRSLTRTLCRIEGIKSDCCGEGSHYSAVSSLATEVINMIYSRISTKWPKQEPGVQTFRDKAIEVTWLGKNKQITLTFDGEEVYYSIVEDKDPSEKYCCLDLTENMAGFLKLLEGINE